MAKNTIVGRTWNRLDRLVRNTMNLDRWPGVKPWNRQSQPLSTSGDLDYVDMQPREYYVSNLFAAIRTRANRVADLAKEHTKTRLFDNPDEEITDIHPYLQLINSSPNFPNTYFWKAISTYLDLPGGCAYVFVLRNYTEQKDKNGKPAVTGKVQQFQIVNPYRVTKITNGSDLEDYRYIESQPGGAWREIPKEQLIIIRSFNPFNMYEGYSISEAVTDDQFSIQQARSYSRQAIRDNVGQRGMLTPSVTLQNEEYTNFIKSINDRDKEGKGKFLTTNAPVDYKDMQIDLDKLALEAINNISIETLIAVTGASKTILGIEQSGVTRDSSRAQRELFTENHAIPQLTDILDALNQDYKNSYPVEYNNKKLEMFVDSPLKVDKDRETADAKNELTKAQTAETLIGAGYEPNAVTEFVFDEELQFEARQPKASPLGMPPQQDPQTEDPSLQSVLNRFTPGMEGTIRGFEVTLENQINNIQGQVLQAMLPKLGTATNAPKGSINKDDEKRLTDALATALTVFSASIVSLFGPQTISRRLRETGLPGEFSMTPEVNKAIKAKALESAKSHMDTFTKEIYKEARKAGEQGLGREEITRQLTNKYPSIARWQARRVARTESYKAVNLAQYEADTQFLSTNDLIGRATKQWVTQSNNPCPYCQEMDGTEVDFADPFLGAGDTVKAEFDQDQGTVTREFSVNDSTPSPPLHPNCTCTYELVIA